ncbi:hypothetical protein QQS21_003379 [Conoideocrella luteorostrata]|uniref:Kinesin light chain n=1 Tax=Conoideocrella luteorostrata TaxID=1105319 RepID=A0AAJ0CWE9_9HYPO|nr:hypothetical protein QQS21_003379 [Conoideocrella luteorostrata]
MRLLECSDGKFKLTKDLVHKIPKYAILSHTWGLDHEEVTFGDIVHGTGEDKIGYKKIWFCAEQARRDGLQYFWVDTCCIDRSNNNELSMAINSMFRWYKNATRCYVYLSDIPAACYENRQQSELAWESAFRAHRWFTRGWTLQELLSPASVEFFTPSGQRLGDKRSLEQQIHEITGIAVPALRGKALSEFDVEERFKWAETRQTTHEEDSAYCLLGIFSIFMPLIYGEGKAHALRRLKKQIVDAMSCDVLPNQQGANRTWMVPFERNPFFTGRESELKCLRQALSPGYQTAKVAITGLGGVGKTQLALELIYRVAAENNNCSVFWIPVTSKESLGQAYLHAAGQLGISGWEDNKADVIKLVQDHLSSESAGQWLLVFDNADDVGMWLEKSTPESSPLIDYLPRSSHGSVIFTTRNKKAAIKLAGRNVVEISEMDGASGKQLLGKHLIDKGLLGSEGDATTLLARLTYLPLAIVQAAVYVNANGISLGDYLLLLEEQEEDVIDLLSEDFEDEGRYRDGKNPVATTWLVSFEQIWQRDPLAAEYLFLMSCVDAKDIPLSFLPPGPSRKKETDAMGTLQGYSFIAKRSVHSTVHIHRLVHLAMRNWLRKEGLLPGWTSRAIARLVEVVGNVGYDNRTVWNSYMPHMYYMLGSRLTGDHNEGKLNLLWKYGLCLYYDGRYQEAEAPFERVMKAHKTKLGYDHPDTLASMGNLASTYWNQGRWKEAEKLEVQVTETRKAELGTDHPDTLTSMASLALTYRKQGRWEEAEKLFIQVMVTRMRVLGEEHLDTLTSVANLAAVLWDQGLWQEAKELEVQIMEMRKRVLGEEHPLTTTNIANLASIYWNQGRLKEAEALELRVIDTRTSVLGKEHPLTLISIANLASTFWDQGRWKEAEELEVQVMEIRQTALGKDHPDTLTSMANLALTFWDQGRWKEAEALVLQVIEIRKRLLGEEHPDTLISMANLGSMWWDQGQWEKAEKLEVQVMEIRKRVLGEEHPDTLTSMASLSHTWKSRGRSKDAIDMMRDCVLRRQRLLGLDHPDTESSLATLTEWQEASNLPQETTERK